MNDITLVTAVDKTVVCNFHDYLIPAGSKGRVIDIIIDNGKVSFQLEFDDNEIAYEWFAADEVEERY